MSRADKVLCPFCPRLLSETEYRAHFEALHAVDIVNGGANEFRPPRKPPQRTRRAVEHDEPLWED